MLNLKTVIKTKKSFKLLCIALIILLLASIVVRGMDNGWGSVDVKSAKTVSPNGYLMSYKLYIPKSATPTAPAPALVWMVGGGASLDESSMVAIEAAKRGYIVIVADVPGNGQSEPIVNSAGGNGSSEAVPINSMSEGLNYTSAAMDIVKSLAVTDQSQIVLGGHSMGGYYSSLIAQQRSDEIVACLIMGTYGFSGNPEDPTNFNYALILGQGDESSLYRTTNYRTLSEAIQAPSSKGLFGVGENEDIEVGKLYGSYADQSARIIYTPNTMHMLEPDSAECMRLFLHELEASTTAPKSMSNSSFTYWIKDIAMFVVFADLSLILFALVQLLLGTEFFSSLVLERENRYIGFEPKSGPWVAAVAFLTFACCCLYIFGYQYYSKLPIVGKLGNAGGKCVWSVLTGMVLAVYLIIFHIIRGKKNGAVAGDYGLATTSASGFSPMYLLKCLAFGGTVFAIIYGLFAFYVAFTGCNVHVVLFCNELALLEPTKLAYKGLPIFLFMFVFIFVNAIAQKTIAGKSGSMVKEVLFTNLVGTIGFVGLFIAFVTALLGPHICLFAANRGCFGAETLLGVTASFWMINTSVYYLNKKTNSVWPGTIMATFLMTWMCIFATGMNF